MIRKFLRQLFIRDLAAAKIMHIMRTSPYPWPNEMRTLNRLDRIAAGHKPFQPRAEEWTEALKLSGNIAHAAASNSIPKISANRESGVDSNPKCR